MSFLGRSFAPAKWVTATFPAEGDDVSADALTSCLRTTGATLSFWRCTNDRQGAAEVALAIAARRQHLDKISIAILSEDELLQQGFSLEEKEGDSPVEDLRDRHVNLRHLNRSRLVRFSSLFLPIARSDSGFHQFTRKDVDSLLRGAIAGKRLSPDLLDDDLRRDLKL